MDLGKGKLGGAVNRHGQVKFAFFCSALGDIDVKVADRILLEFALLWWLLGHLRQTADAMSLQTTMQRGARQVRNSLLERIQAINQGQ